MLSLKGKKWDYLIEKAFLVLIDIYQILSLKEKKWDYLIATINIIQDLEFDIILGTLISCLN